MTGLDMSDEEKSTTDKIVARGAMPVAQRMDYMEGDLKHMRKKVNGIDDKLDQVLVKLIPISLRQRALEIVVYGSIAVCFGAWVNSQINPPAPEKTKTEQKGKSTASTGNSSIIVKTTTPTMGK